METRMTAEIPLRFQPDQLRIDGEGQLYNESISATVPGCSTTVTRGGGTLTVNRLDWVVPAFDPTLALGTVTDVTLGWDPSNTTESGTLTCPPAPTGPLAFLSWTSMYINVHESEINPQVGVLTTGWTIEGDEEYADKAWSDSVDSISESGNFVLRHTPDQ
jgi:hypothetical protein